MPNGSCASGISCHQCSMSDLCLPFSLNNRELSQLDNIIQRKKPFQKGQVVCSAGEPLHSIFAIRSGSFKTFTLNSDGGQQITSFNLPGDIIGFDSLGTGVHQSFTVALDTAMVCEIPFATLDQLSSSLPRLRQQMMRLMSNEILADNNFLMLLNQCDAKTRLATFICELSERYGERGYSDVSFKLAMTRTDIANYLGLTVETISRLLTDLKRANLIDITGKFITIVNKDDLRART